MLMSFSIYRKNKDSDPIKCQCCPHIETSQSIGTANQLTGFCMRTKLALYGLKIAMNQYYHFIKRFKQTLNSKFKFTYPSFGGQLSRIIQKKSWVSDIFLWVSDNIVSNMVYKTKYFLLTLENEGKNGGLTIIPKTCQIFRIFLCSYFYKSSKIPSIVRFLATARKYLKLFRCKS